MNAKSAATNHWKKAMKMGLTLLGRGFNSSKCKTNAKMAVARVKLLRNKREVVIKQMRRDIAMLLEAGQDATARIRVEHVIREQNIMAANELIELFCELVVARLSIIAKQRECPADLKEGISSLLFAGPRCSDIPELLSIRDVFQKKYGKDFVSAATDLRPNAGVNRLLIEKLSVKTPSGEIKLKVLKEIAKEYQIKWDTTESEEELLKPPEERIDGPNNFVSATSMPLKPVQKQSPEPNNATNSGGQNKIDIVNFQELASAAGEAAQKAVAAAQAAAVLAAVQEGRQISSESFGSKQNEQKSVSSRRQSYNNNCQRAHTDDVIKFDDYSNSNEQKSASRRQSYNNCRRAHKDDDDVIKFDDYSDSCDEEVEMEKPPLQNNAKNNRRHSYNVPPPAKQSGIRFDESDPEDDDDEVGPPGRPAPEAPVRRSHPKLPDYDVLAARFEALKHHKSQT